MRHHKSNSIRIIGGKWRGRRLPVLDNPELRPTSDRVRETLFNWLMYDVVSSHCLDLCAGSGGLAMECLSRGAMTATLVERDAGLAEQLRKNLCLLSAEAEAEIVQQDAIRFLCGVPKRQFDIVFLDPPYQAGLLPQFFSNLEQQQWLADGAKIYFEHNDKLDSSELPVNWSLYRSGKAGQVHFFLYSRFAVSHHKSLF